MVVCVARKPLPINMLVSQCASKLGTGAINIDASRTPVLNGEHVAPGGVANPANRHGTVGTMLGMTNAAVSTFQQAQLDSIERVNRMGRFPCNLILQHLPDCRLSGTKQVTGNKLGTVPRVSNSNTGIYQPRPAVVKHHHANTDGSETVQAWECVAGCPVAELDTLSATGCYLNTASRYFYSVQETPE